MWDKLQDMWDKLQELNAASAPLGEAPWWYCGDMDIREGGIAVRVNRMFAYADIVEATDLASVTGQHGVALIESNTVSLGGCFSDRQRYRSAMATVGLSMRELIADYPGEERWKVWAEIARALYIYGYRDMPTSLVVRHEEADASDDPFYGDGMTVDETVDGQAGLEEAFMGMLP